MIRTTGGTRLAALAARARRSAGFFVERGARSKLEMELPFVSCLRFEPPAPSSPSSPCVPADEGSTTSDAERDDASPAAPTIG